VRKADATADIEKAVHQLREYHTLGRRLLKDHPAGRKHSRDVIGLEAAENGMKPIKIFQIRDFANEEKGYTAEELESLIQLCWKHSRALGFSFVPTFLSVRDKKERAKFQREAIAGCWSTTRVEGELVSRYGRRRRAGSRAVVPTDLRALFANLQTRTIYWRRLRETLQQKPDSNPSRLRWSELPKKIREPLDEAVEAMKKLESALDSYFPSPKSPTPASRS
jgi:hypothetical protein